MLAVRRSVLLFVLCVVGACAPPPPNLTPQAISAFNNTRVIKGLDIIRDTAIDANAQVPPLLSTATTRKVIDFDDSALRIIHASSTGWAPAVMAGLDELANSKDLSPSEHRLLAPYIALVKTIIQEVGR